jgi:hypothetical protein
MQTVLLNLELAWNIAKILFGFAALVGGLIAGRYLVLMIARWINRRDFQPRPEIPPGFQELLAQQHQQGLDRRWLLAVGDEGQVSAYSAEQELFVTIGEDGKPSGYVRGR